MKNFQSSSDAPRSISGLATGAGLGRTSCGAGPVAALGGCLALTCVAKAWKTVVQSGMPAGVVYVHPSASQDCGAGSGISAMVGWFPCGLVGSAGRFRLADLVLPLDSSVSCLFHFFRGVIDKSANDPETQLVVSTCIRNDL